MRWDEVEREFFVIGNQLARLSHSFRALAGALAREREAGNVSSVNRDAPPEGSENEKGGDGASALSLPF